MNRTTKYSEIIEKYLLEFEANSKNDPFGFTTQAIIDKNRNQYQLVSHGFRGERFLYSVLFHFEVIDEKVRLYRNTTDIEIGEELEKRGVLKSDLYLMFLSESGQIHSGYGFEKKGKAA